MRFEIHGVGILVRRARFCEGFNLEIR
jgi:hypothetical protein